MSEDDTVWLSIGGQKFGGWTAVRVTRGLERTPGDFQLTMSERYPGEPLRMPIAPGQPCIVQFGASIVLSGWIDRVMPSFERDHHSITVIGRGRCCDLIDCSAFADNRQFLDHSVLDIATAVCRPFNIVVSQHDPGAPALPNQPTTADGQVIPSLNVNLLTTPWEIIETVSRYAGLIPYELATGDVMLAQVGTMHAASGFQSGINVQSASAMAAVDMRYSRIYGMALAVDSTLQLNPGAPPASNISGANKWETADDIGVPRYRPLAIVSEQGYGSLDILKLRVKWEIARRYGRSQAVTLTVDSWRDASGSLWEINTLAPLDIPELHLGSMTWLICEVSFSVDKYRGKVADITLMPPGAFTPAPPPALLDGQTQQAINESKGAQ